MDCGSIQLQPVSMRLPRRLLTPRWEASVFEVCNLPQVPPEASMRMSLQLGCKSVRQKALEQCKVAYVIPVADPIPRNVYVPIRSHRNPTALLENILADRLVRTRFDNSSEYLKASFITVEKQEWNGHAGAKAAMRAVTPNATRPRVMIVPTA